MGNKVKLKSAFFWISLNIFYYGLDICFFFLTMYCSIKFIIN